MHVDPCRAPTPSALGVLVATAAGGAGVLAATASWAGLVGTPGALQLVASLQTLAVVALLGAAALCFARWRVDSQSPSGHLGLALVVYALGSLPAGSVVSRLAGDSDASALDEAVRLVATVIVALLALAALRERSREVSTLRRLLPRLARLVVTGAVMIAALDRLVALAGWNSVGLSWLAFGLELTTGLVWVGVALVAWRGRAISSWTAAVVPLAIGLAGVRVVDAFAADRAGSSAQLGATLLWAGVTMLIVVCAMTSLFAAIDRAHRESDAVWLALESAAHGNARRDAWREELNHDAVGALSGLRAALSTMSRYDDTLGSDAARRLREAAIAEVAHLEHLVARSTTDRPIVFDVAEVIGAVVETRRACGLAIDVDVSAGGPERTPGEGRAVGRNGDLATVLHNLLINAHTHAHGSRVRVSVTRSADEVGVNVVDDGPGIDLTDRERVFRRGESGGSSLGTGLGLYVARELMREQGGDVVLEDSSRGCHFLVTLPAASAASGTPAVPVLTAPSPAAVTDVSR